MFTRACETTCQGAQGVLSISIKLYLLFFSPFLIGSNPLANSSEPTGTDLMWKMRAIYHRFDGIFDWKRGIDQRFLQAQRPSCVFTGELKKSGHGYPKTK